ncbi:MAG: methyltransferase domain-containing protein [Chloroflexi bacterium]|nr:methyltransferase domain-containing protein [Chloroflexota bacterium]
MYDTLMRSLMRESAVKHRLVGQARIQKRQRVLDLGCGTGTLAILIKEMRPDAEVIGLDADPQVLEMARVKIARAALGIRLNEGMSFELPYADSSFDRVLSSFVFHHLTRENKARTLRDVFRVLQPGGELHVADFGKPDNALMYLVSRVMQMFEEVSDNIGGLLPGMFRDAGFEQVEETARYMTFLGTVSLYRARKP